VCHASPYQAAAALRKWQLLLTELQLLQSKLSAGQACDAADVRALEHAAADAPCLDTLSVAHVKAAVQEQQVCGEQGGMWV
jgi:hypothetical protein